MPWPVSHVTRNQRSKLKVSYGRLFIGGCTGIFDKTFERSMGHEGGYQCDPKDRGNWTGGEVGKGTNKGTKWGLSAATYPSLDIKNITYEQAKEIYYRDWWINFGMDKWPNALAYQMFDAAINHGTVRANQFLQRAVGTKPDGIIGPITTTTVLAADPNDVLLLFLAERLEYFTNVNTWDTYSKGWSRRVAQCLRYAAEDN